MATYLYHVANTRVGQRHPTWLGDPAAYGYIGPWCRAGGSSRGRATSTARRRSKSIGDTARKLGLKVRAIHLERRGLLRLHAELRDSLGASRDENR